MFDPTRYRYFLKPDKMGELKMQFYRLTCARNGDQQHLGKTELLNFLHKEGIDIKLSALPYFDRELFKEEDKREYNCREAITMVDRLSINSDIEKQYEKIYKIFDTSSKGKITALDLKRTMIRSINGSGSANKKMLDDGQIEEIFEELDIDQDGLVSYEDFLCAMIAK